jgi:hypothetical protein
LDKAKAKVEVKVEVEVKEDLGASPKLPRGSGFTQ